MKPKPHTHIELFRLLLEIIKFIIKEIIGKIRVSKTLKSLIRIK